MGTGTVAVATADVIERLPTEISSAELLEVTTAGGATSSLVAGPIDESFRDTITIIRLKKRADSSAKAQKCEKYPEKLQVSIDDSFNRHFTMLFL